MKCRLAEHPALCNASAMARKPEKTIEIEQIIERVKKHRDLISRYESKAKELKQSVEAMEERIRQKSENENSPARSAAARAESSKNSD